MSLSLPAAALARKRLLSEEKGAFLHLGESKKEKKRRKSQDVFRMQVLIVRGETVTWFRGMSSGSRKVSRSFAALGWRWLSSN